MAWRGNRDDPPASPHNIERCPDPMVNERALSRQQQPSARGTHVGVHSSVLRTVSSSTALTLQPQEASRSEAIGRFCEL